MKVPKMYKSSDRYNAGTDVIYNDESKSQYASFVYAVTKIDDSGGDDSGGDDSGGSGDTVWETVFDSDINVVPSEVNFIYVSDFDVGFYENETYRVTWGLNTEPYICTAFEYQNSYTGYAIGNQAFTGGEDSGEPFFIRMSAQTVAVGATSSAAGTLHLTVEKEVTQ